MTHYELFNRRDYFSDLVRRIGAAKSGERVLLAAMAFDPSVPQIADILAALVAAAQRGAKVLLLVDAINFLMDRHGIPGPLLIRRSFAHMHGQYTAAYQQLETLKAAGGRYRITNIPRDWLRLPISGRSHIKGAVIGDRVYIGGCNLECPEQLDVMISWADKKAADTMHDWFERIVYDGRVREAFSDVDVDVSLDDTTRLLLDAGVPDQSLIYDEALRLIDSAERWIYLTCQFFPGGLTAKHLADAQTRGVQVEIAYSHPRSHGSAAALHHVHQLQERTRRLPPHFFTGRLSRYSPKLHAKILANEKEVLIGSHNYVPQGVRLGTAELALYSSDPALSEALSSFMHHQLASAQQTPAGSSRKRVGTA